MPKDLPPHLYGEKRDGFGGPKKPSKSPSKKKVKRPRNRGPIFGFMLKTLLVLIVWGTLILSFCLIWFTYDLPNIDKLQMAARRPSVTITSPEGKVIGTYGDLYADMVKIQELPPYVPQAVLSIEDRRFYSHFGIDVIGVVRALYKNWRAERVVQGGSGITQQLSKNFLMTQGVYGTYDRSFRRKIQEAIMALWLEWHFTKEQILTIYLNRIYFGSGTYGIDAASRKYFNKSARHINVVEAAMLAGLLQAPSKFSPAQHPERAMNRAKIVLQQMLDEGYIQDIDSYIKQYDEQHAQDKPIDNSQGIRFFTDWVYEQVPTYVSIENKDLIVTTTIDMHLQEIAENAVKEKFNEMGKELKVTEMGLVTLANDGAIRALVGGVDYNKNQFNHVTIAKRQPGSAFKVFIYLAALEAGLSPETLVEDTPFSIGKWSPKNFGRYEPQGEISLLDGLANSVNAVSIRLTMFVGPERIAQLAQRLGITSKMGRDLSMALGTFETTLLDLTAAFATLSNHGMALWPYAITEIKDKEGNVLYKRQPPAEKRLINAYHLKNMLSMMQAVTTKGTGRAAQIGLPMAGKTGSNGDRDAWFIGFPLGGLVTGVWVGNDDNKPMKKVSTGGRLPARTWSAYMKNVIKEYPPQPFSLEVTDAPSTQPIERLAELTRGQIPSALSDHIELQEGQEIDSLLGQDETASENGGQE